MPARDPNETFASDRYRDGYNAKWERRSGIAIPGDVNFEKGSRHAEYHF